jgi:hypothetical protein
MKLLSILTALLLTSAAALHPADNFLVENGHARAEIIIAEKECRTTIARKSASTKCHSEQTLG